MDLRQIRAFVDFLEAAYRLDTDNERWMRDLLITGRAVSGGSEATFVLMYDASDVAAFHEEGLCFEGPEGMGAALAAAPAALTPTYVARTFRSLLVDAFTRTTSAPELDAFFARMQDLGFSDSLAINGLATGPRWSGRAGRQTRDAGRPTIGSPGRGQQIRGSPAYVEPPGSGVRDRDLAIWAAPEGHWSLASCGLGDHTAPRGRMLLHPAETDTPGTQPGPSLADPDPHPWSGARPLVGRSVP